MKRIIALIVLAGMMATATAQVKMPAPSPSCKITQMVGLAEITLDYSRPGKKDREIFGDLVPYGEIWRTGANGATKITFSEDVKLEGNEVVAGTYAMYTIPGKSEWTVMLYKDLKLGGNVAKYDEEMEYLRFTVKSQAMGEEMENMMLFIDYIRDDMGMLILAWDKTMIGMKIELATEEAVMASIESTLSGPASRDYYLASMYYYNNEKDMEQALAWMEKALEDGDRYWMVTRKGQMQAALGMKKEAKATAQKALEMAKEAGNMDYVRMNEATLEGLQ